MSMRKKKYLDERLEACESVCLGWIPDPVHANGKVCITDKAAVFGREAPLHLEIGCGKGKFANTLAAREPGIDFIAVEQTPNVIVAAMEHTKELGLPNLRYFMGKAEYLRNVLAPDSVERIYLNFSCPFPKTKYAKHRLTHKRFLDIYRDILADGGKIIQKTDNRDFFEFSLESFRENGFELAFVTEDLHNSGITGNIITEYEQRFLSQGLPIYYLEAVNSK